MQEGVRVDDEARQNERLDGKPVARASSRHGADLGLFDGEFVEIFAPADVGIEVAGAVLAAMVCYHW